jgi:DNA-binding beta-propeller fold protein YncE
MLSLTYAPTVTAAGTLSLGFSYANDSGFSRTGTVLITYSAVTPYLYVANGNSNTLSSCAIHFDDSLAACTATASSLDVPDGIALNGSYAYITNTLGNSVSRCTLDAGGALAGCTATGGVFGSPTNIAVNPIGAFAYIDQNTGLTVCATAPSDGSLSGCVAASAPFDPLYGIALSADGTHAYAVHGPSNAIAMCSVAMDGALANCTDTAASTAQAVAALAIRNNDLYVSTSVGSLYMCPININSTISSCQTTAVGTNAAALAFIDTTAYLSTNSATVLACPVNADGTLGSCVTLSDPTFNGTAGMAVR